MRQLARGVLAKAGVAIRGICIGVVALAFLGFGVSSDRSMPRNARVYIDPERNVYLAPPCLELTDAQRTRFADLARSARSYRDSMSALVRVTGLFPAVAAEVHDLQLRPEPRCRESGAFFEEGRSLTGAVLERLGMLGPKPSRWNADGSWNW